MKIVNQSYELQEIPNGDNELEILKFIEKIGRTCYKSEDKITDDSAVKFVNMIKKNKHWAMMEHFIFVLEVPEFLFNCLHNISNYMIQNQKSIEKINYIRSSYYYDDYMKPHYIISGSSTSFNYLWEAVSDWYVHSSDIHQAVTYICLFLYDNYPNMIQVPGGINPDQEERLMKRLRIITRDELATLDVNTRLLHTQITTKFVTNRKVTHEIVRHRPASFAQESTRYCNYSNGKHGSEITFIDQIYHPEGSVPYNIWKKAMENAEKFYMEMIEAGCKAQEAALVLPNSTKADIFMTCRANEMNHFFKMRADRAADPMMQDLAYPLKAECTRLYPDLII